MGFFERIEDNSAAKASLECTIINIYIDNLAILWVYIRLHSHEMEAAPNSAVSCLQRYGVFLSYYCCIRA